MVRGSACFTAFRLILTPAAAGTGDAPFDLLPGGSTAKKAFRR